MAHRAHFRIGFLVAIGRRARAAGMCRRYSRKARLERKCEHEEGQSEDRDSVESISRLKMECITHSQKDLQFSCRSRLHSKVTT